MAIAASRWFSVYQLIDTGGKVVSRKYEQSAPADDTAARASAAAMATDLQAVTDCVIKSYYTYQEFVEGSLSLPTGAEAEMQAFITVGIEGEPLKHGTLTIPAPKTLCFVDSEGSNYDVVDGTATEVAAFLANFDSETLFYVSDGEQMDGFQKGHRRHVKSVRG